MGSRPPGSRNMRPPNFMSDPDIDREKPQPLSQRQVVGRIMAALLGVQNSRNHARDTAGEYIVVGLIATIGLVLLDYLGVKIILRLVLG